MVEVSGGVFEPRRSEVRMRRSRPGLLELEDGARSLKSKSSVVGIRPADIACEWLYFAIRFANDEVMLAVALSCKAAIVSALAMMTVGAIERVASVRSTPGSATEVMAREACW